MWWILLGTWKYRSELIIALHLLSKIRKSAQEITREYIRKRIETKLKSQILIVSLEIGLFLGAFFLNQNFPSLGSRLVASSILWLVTLYNIRELFFSTIPEIRSLHSLLKSRIGYAAKYLLEVSLVTELMQLNVVFLCLCLIFGISTRTVIGTYFSYTKPWAQWIHSGHASSVARPGKGKRVRGGI
jgi:hypothetical protein